ncbi:MAG: DUF4331 domain-containing protein [Ardenticatenaceae bacterium]|nr:DUF4331 domain-containing protein [Ardenticatenaceae bacterium]HBY98722.1 hypothetical protein [Chloroflexota bacterium]
MNHLSPISRRFLIVASAALTPIVLVAVLLIGYGPTQVNASSHREAPLIAADPYADTTDVYAFVSPDRPDSVTIIASWIPLESPEGGPNYYKFADDVLYELHVDNVGDGRSHVTYQFRFKTEVRNSTTFLYNTGPIGSLTDPNWNVRQFYTVTEIVSPTAGSRVTKVLGSNLPSPPVNIGSKSTSNYDALFNAGIRTITNSGDNIKVFAGQTDDAFFVDLGSVFDLLSLRGQAPPIGYPGGPTPGLDGLSGYNVHSIALQVPISRLLASAPSGETVIGVWATSSRQSTRVLAPLGGVSTSGDWVQVSRLGMPLTNEAVLPLALKDAFNGLKPEQDYGLFTSGTPAGNLLASSVLTPELQTLLNALYGVPNPGKPRTDLVEIFLTGIQTDQPFAIHTPGGDVTLPAGTVVNKPTKSAAIQPAEMLRLNTAFRPGTHCAPTPNYQLGLLGGDACGFPNGRRLADDVTDIELLAVAGAAWQVVTGDTSFSFNPALIGVLSDSVSKNDKPFRSTFPYLAEPHQGQEHYHSFLSHMWLAAQAKNWFVPLP